MPKLYDLARGSKIKLPITDGKETHDEVCTFECLDGVYSVIETPSGHIVHLAAYTELRSPEKLGEPYELAEDDWPNSPLK